MTEEDIIARMDNVIAAYKLLHLPSPRVKELEDCVSQAKMAFMVSPRLTQEEALAAIKPHYLSYTVRGIYLSVYDHMQAARMGKGKDYSMLKNHLSNYVRIFSDNIDPRTSGNS